MTIYGPDDQWPEHDEPRWNEVLAAARAKGWTLETFTSHRFGQLKCPSGDPSCNFPKIDKTAVATEIFAKRKKRIINKCPHSPEQQEETVESIRDLLAKAKRLVDGAESLLKRNAARAEVEELLDLADDNTRSAQEIEAAFDLADWYAGDYDRQATEALEGSAFEGATDPAPVLDAADESAVDADEQAQQVFSTDARRDELKAESAALRDRISELRVQDSRDSADTR